MAATDATRESNYFQKRGVSVFVADFVETDINGDGSKFGNLPERSLVIAAGILVTTVSTTGSSTLDILVGSTVVANEVAVTAAGFIAGTMVAANQYFATGGDIIVKDGSTAPAAGDLVGELVMEYIELDKVTGEYTEMTQG